MYVSSCMYSDNARLFKKRKKHPKFNHLHISQSHWRNCRRYRFLNHITQFFRIWFLTQLTESRIWNINNIIENYGRMFCKTNSWNCFLLCVCILCICGATDKLWRHKDVALYMTHRTMHRFSTMHHIPRCTVHCEVGGIQGILKYAQRIPFVPPISCSSRLTHWKWTNLA